MASVILKKSADSFIKRKHPWIFSGAIEKVEGSPSNGQTVQILTSNKTSVGFGSFSPSSQIRVRVWSFVPEEKIDGGTYAITAGTILQCSFPQTAGCTCTKENEEEKPRRLFR